MPLETSYQNPEVVITTSATPRQEEFAKNVKCIGLILITYFLVTFTLEESLLLCLSLIVLLVALVMLIQNRPRISMNSIKKVVRVSGRDASQSFQFAPNLVEKIVVKSKHIKPHRNLFGGNRTKTDGQSGQEADPYTWYYTQMLIKEPRAKKGKKRKGGIALDSFELNDIVEAHYMAQLLSAFTGASAFDVAGKMLPPLKSYIPSKYLKQD